MEKTVLVRVGIIEDDVEIRDVIQASLDQEKQFSCKHAFGSVEEILGKQDVLAELDVILMDIGLPGMSGIDGMKLIKESHPDLEIVMLTIYHDSQKIFNSLCAGASGYLLKNTPLPELKASIEQLLEGGAPMSPQIARKVIKHFAPEYKPKPRTSLTPKEKQIVVGLVDGLSYKLIADRMNISVETVRFHIKNIYQKLHVHSKAEVISKSLKGEI